MIARAYTPQERSFELIEHVAIAIRLVQGVEGQQHVGIFHKDETTKDLRMIHLAWHHELKNSHPNIWYIWIAPPIPQRRARQVAAFCRKVSRSNPAGIPYAFSQATDCFDQQTGSFIFGPSRNGLTCASFVLGVFQSTGLTLIDHDTWPRTRDGDEKWQRSIIEQLKQDEASEDHILRVESEIGCVRYRPEDVAGAGAADDLPASFEEVSPLAEEILAKLKNWQPIGDQLG
jgi:hypothetical protein